MHPVAFTWSDKRLAFFAHQLDCTYVKFAKELNIPIGTFKQYAGGRRKTPLIMILRLLHLYRTDKETMVTVMNYFIWDSVYLSTQDLVSGERIAANSPRDTTPSSMFITDPKFVRRFVYLVRRRLVGLNREHYGTLTGISQYSIKNHELGLRVVSAELFFQTLLLLEDYAEVLHRLLHMKSSNDFTAIIKSLRLTQKSQYRAESLPQLKRKDRVNGGE
jgi:hypothetical protein